MISNLFYFFSSNFLSFARKEIIPAKRHTPQFDRHYELTEIKKVIHICAGWAKDKSLTQLYNVIANDSGYLRIAPYQNILRGFDQVKRNMAVWMNLNFKQVDQDIKELTINLSNSGEMAWFFCILTEKQKCQDEEINWKNMRWTGVLEKRNYKWIMVQQHFSLPQVQ